LIPGVWTGIWVTEPLNIKPLGASQVRFPHFSGLAFGVFIISSLADSPPPLNKIYCIDITPNGYVSQEEKTDSCMKTQKIITNTSHWQSEEHFLRQGNFLDAKNIARKFETE
jgi:hypothetical protein